MFKLILWALLLTNAALFNPQAKASPLPFTPAATSSEAVTDKAVANEEAANEAKAFSVPAAWKKFTFWIMQQQRQYHRSLSAKVEALSEQQNLANTGWLLLLSFLYGVFHAAGPGHGKAVLTTYLLTQPEKLRQGLQLSVLAALLQGVTAIVLVSLLVHGLGWLAKEAFASVIYIEAASFLLVAVLGLLLIIRGLKQLVQARKIAQFKPVTAAGFAPLQLSATSLSLSPTALASSACSSCGKTHHIAPEQLAGRNRLQSLGLVASIGLRPCSGAVLVLVATNLMGLWWIGVFATLTMAVGTALTVASLAILAVQARLLAKRLLKLQSNRFSQLAAVLALVGGGFIFFLGIGLFSDVLLSEQALMPF